eukprot:2356614-Rhodomonas_salina.3
MQINMTLVSVLLLNLLTLPSYVVLGKRVFFAFSLTGWANDAYIVSWANCALIMQTVFMLFLVKSIELSAPVCSSKLSPFHINCTKSVHLSASSNTFTKGGVCWGTVHEVTPVVWYNSGGQGGDSRLNNFAKQTALVLPGLDEYKHYVELQLMSNNMCSMLEIYMVSITERGKHVFHALGHEHTPRHLARSAVWCSQLQQRLCFRSRLDAHWQTQQHICHANNGKLRLQTSGVHNYIKEPVLDHFIVIPQNVFRGQSVASFHVQRIGGGEQWPWFLSPMQKSRIHQKILQSPSMTVTMFTLHCIITAFIYCTVVDIFTKSVQHTLSAESFYINFPLLLLFAWTGALWGAVALCALTTKQLGCVSRRTISSYVVTALCISSSIIEIAHIVVGRGSQWYPLLVLCLVYIVTRELASVAR